MSGKKKQTKNKGKSRQRKNGLWGSLFAEVLEMPEELTMDMPRITLIGNIKLSVENHKGIIEYGRQNTKLKVNNGYLTALGDDFVLKNISPDEVLLQGKIKEIAIVLDEDFGYSAERQV